MRHPTLSRHGMAILALCLIAVPSWADDDCDAPLSRWQTREAVQQMAAARGWQIQRLKIDDGCYEIRATDAQGRAFKAKVDPETLKVLTMKPADREQLRSRERGHGGPGRQPPRPDGASAPSAPPTADAAPRGWIE